MAPNPVPRSPAFRVSVSYLALFAAMGSFFPFITLYLQEAGWSGTAIGIYSAIGPLVGMLIQPVWGLVGDAMGDARKLFSLLMGITALTVLIFGFFPVTGIFFLFGVLLGLFQAPLNPIMDSLAVSTLGEGRFGLGNTRLWGSVSFALVSMFIGSAFDWNPRVIFFVHAALGGLVIAAVMSLPSAAALGLPAAKLQLSGITEALSRPMVLFLAAVFVLQLGHTSAMSFLSVVMAQRGAPSNIIGYTWSLTALIEIPVFIGASFLLARFGPAKLLVFSAVFTSARIFLFVAAPTPETMLMAHALEGFAFPLMLVSTILIVFELVPEHLRTTGQTLYGAVGQTLPRLVGGLAGGRILDLASASTLYIICGIVTLLGAVCLWLWQQAHGSRVSSSSSSLPS